MKYFFQFFLLGSLFFLSSCGFSRRVTVRFAAVDDEIHSVQPSAAVFNRSPSQVALAIKTPGETPAVTEISGEAGFNKGLTAELIEQGFSLRDRSLIEDILSDNRSKNYASIQKLSKTDVIVDFLPSEVVEFATNTVTLKNGRRKIYPKLQVKVNGTRYRFRLIDVATNTVIGVYAVTKTPCTYGCEYTVTRGTKATPYLPEEIKTEYETMRYPSLAPDRAGTRIGELIGSIWEGKGEGR